ncbi:MAG: SDR family oxidoreductase [Chloroflexi bacterium]|nr:SDR family oxidoreductase [Chloroflexota bacterium]
MRLQEKVALVTGGGAGIGRAIALAFAREGAKVLVAELDEGSGRSVVEEIGAAGRFQRCDTSSEAEVRAAVQAAIDGFGRLDIMVNNAGVAQRDWDTTLAVNLSGVYYGCKHAAEAMAAKGGGVIVNLSSILGLVGIGGEDPYVAAKHGVVGLTKNFAIAYGQRGVRVNCINPGWIETAMTRMITDAPAVRQQIEGQTPMGRLGTAEEVAKAALFLASDDSSFMTGASLVVDGGWTAR